MKRVLLCVAALLATGLTYGNEPVFPDSLNFAKTISLDEIVVRATRVHDGTPVSYSTLSNEELNRRNDGQGVPYLILHAPSVTMSSDAGTGIGYSYFRIRGTDANRINVTVNGVPTNDAESQTVFWANMADITSSVDNIQIQRGVGTSTNGGAAFGATVAMQTVAPKLKPYLDYSLSAGSYGSIKHTVEGGTGLLYDKFVFDGRYSDIRSDGYIDRTKADMSSYYLSGSYYGTNTMIRFLTFGNSEETYMGWGGVPEALLKTHRTYNPCGEYTVDGVTKYYDNQKDYYWQSHYHLLASQRFNEHWTGNITLHYTKGDGYYEEYKPGAKFSAYKLTPFTNGDGDLVEKSDLVRRKWLDNDFYGGIFSTNYQSEKMLLTIGGAVNNYVCDHFGRVIWTKQNVGTLPEHEYYRNTGKKLDYNVYAKLNYQFLPVLAGYLDMQYRGINYKINGDYDKPLMQDQDKQYDFFNPKVGFNFSKGYHNAFASFSVGHREPGRDNFLEAGKDEQPTFETLYDYEAGYSFATDRMRFGVNLYYMDYDNQLILTGKISDIGELLTSNLKKSYRTGVELEAGVKIASWLDWTGNLTLSNNKIKDFTEYVYNYDTDQTVTNTFDKTDIAFSPNVIANCMFDFSWKGFQAGLYSHYVGRQYLDNTADKGSSIDPYFVQTLHASYSFKPAFMKEVIVGVTVNNLFDEKYETGGHIYDTYISEGKRVKENYYFPQAGINALARITLKF